ncbi:MAG: GH15 [uncultured Acidimicrobiales bacterium]|uniref:GH15 n=1 Tax=uncultured Acidimicrobiales bacterium TaxID=310071 RepID=A0A6J4HDD2_9ACTN|nr:MAG: GH15 [uncultured Acidimicrobiales bacterium]
MTEGGRRGPPIGGHRLLSNGRSLALVTAAAEIDWWCAPDLDCPPLMWSLLDHRGAAARWIGARYASTTGRPAGPSARGIVVIDGTRVAYRDGLVDVEGTACVVRLVRSEAGDVRLCHQLAVGGFGGPWGTPGPDGFQHEESTVGVVTDGESTVDAEWLSTTIVAGPGRWAGLVITAGPAALTIAEAVARLDEDERAAGQRLGRARLPRHHPERAADALAVLEACTYQPTGAVVASATTSLPEAPGADRQFDYRYCWLRDAALATSVASLLGQGDAARHHLKFLCSVAGSDPQLNVPVVDVRGDPVPEERAIEGIEGWAQSRPVRVGNSAAGQLQYDAWGLVVEAVSVHLQTGGSLDDSTWTLVRTLADRIAADEPESSAGIWELRDPKLLLSGDIGRWLVLDRAIWIARGWRPTTRRRHWRHARTETRNRVLAAIDGDGRLPQTYDHDYRPDASALMVPLFGLLPRRDPRALRLIRTVLDDLGAGPFLYRYPPGGDDGFSGTEGAFLPMGWWAVAALAVTGQVKEAEARADQLCALLPPLLSEETDPVDATALGNVPLVWSHMELARALYLLDAARLRHRYGTAALTAWRIARFASLRRRTRTTTTRRHHAATDKETDMGNDRDGRRSVRPRASRARASSIRPNHAGLGRRSTPEAEAVSDALRRGTDAFLTRRRRTAALCLTSIGSLGIVAAYQNGLIRRLPEPPLPGLDADRVDASGEAYQYLKTPDAALGIVSTAITLVLAGMGDANRSQSRRWIPLALAVKAVLDAAFGLFLTAEQATKHRKFCSFCLLAALTNLATVPQTWPEARAAWRNQK